MANESQSTKNNKFREQSAALLKAEVTKEIKTVFKAALNCLEIRFGTDFEGYEATRAQILRAGNDAIRNVSRIIDDKFIIERVREVFTVRFKDRNDLEKGEGNGSTEE